MLERLRGFAAMFLRAAALLSVMPPSLAWPDVLHPELRALLASPALAGQPIKGVYFFAGEVRDASVYTASPTNPDDLHWSSNPESHARVLDRMVAAHVNSVVMSYWSIMPQFSPMAVTSQDLKSLINGVAGRPLVIIPALESGFDSDPKVPQWNFQAVFPPSNGSAEPGLVARIGELTELFSVNEGAWARVYDRNGEPRHAVHILHVCSDRRSTTDAQFVAGFKAAADAVELKYHFKVGFLLDAIGFCNYSAAPLTTGRALANEPSVLAVNGYASEVFSGKVINGRPCTEKDWHRCESHNNNPDNLSRLADWKRAATADWIASGLPVILDVDNGYDGRIIFHDAPGGTGFWGDNMQETDDRWRNWMSELKGGGIRGIVVDTWNGFTEGYAAVPTSRHESTVYNWLTDLLEPDPRDCSHMHYVNKARSSRVYGAICEKWKQLGADRGFGRPITGEAAEGAGRMSRFEGGKSIYWSGATGAHEVHGIIAETYASLRGANSCLGLPISDELPNGGSKVSRFQFGQIDWSPGETRGRPICRTH